MRLRYFIIGTTGLLTLMLSAIVGFAQDSELPDLLATATVFVQQATQDGVVPEINISPTNPNENENADVSEADSIILTTTAVFEQLTQESLVTPTRELSSEEAFVASATALIEGLTRTVEATPLPDQQSFSLTATGLFVEFTRLAPTLTPTVPPTLSPIELTAAQAIDDAMTQRADATLAAIANATDTPEFGAFNQTATAYVVEGTATAVRVFGADALTSLSDARSGVSPITWVFAGFLVVMGALLAVVYFSNEEDSGDTDETDSGGNQH